MLIRIAEPQDCDEILEWRNNAVTRKMFFRGDVVDHEIHREWFHKSIENQQRVLVIGIEKKKKIGVVRYDNTGDIIEVSINLSPEFRGKRLAPALLLNSEKLMPSIWHSQLLVAEIKRENFASIKTFESARYRFLKNGSSQGHKICIYQKSLI